MEKGNIAATENRDRYYMQQALIEAQTAYERGEIPVGAVIVHKDRVIARSHNLTETLRRCHRLGANGTACIRSL